VLACSGSLSPILDLLDSREVKGRAVMEVGGNALVVIPMQDVHGPDVLKSELVHLGAHVRTELGTVTCVGVGLNTDWQVSRTAHAVASNLGVSVTGSWSTSLQLTLVVQRDELPDLTRALHDRLVLGLSG
jgi:aspartate kinase